MNLDLDHLTLRVAGLSAAEGRRLAGLVAWQLAAAEAPDSAAANDGVSVRLGARPGESLKSMAQRIVAETLHSLERSL